MEQRWPGMLVVWVFGDYGHVAFVEEVTNDKTRFRISDFNRNEGEAYNEYDADIDGNWLNFEGATHRTMYNSVYPQFYRLSSIVLEAPWFGEKRITQGFFGETSHYDHGTWDNTYALDIGVRVGTPVLAPFDGEVTGFNDDPITGGGRELYIKSDDGQEVVFLHLSRILVDEHQRVYRGQVVALSGESGPFCQGPHLHFHVWNRTGSRNSHTQMFSIRLKRKNIDPGLRVYMYPDLRDEDVAGGFFSSNNAAPPGQFEDGWHYAGGAGVQSQSFLDAYWRPEPQ